MEISIQILHVNYAIFCSQFSTFKTILLLGMYYKTSYRLDKILTFDLYTYNDNTNTQMTWTLWQYPIMPRLGQDYEFCQDGKYFPLNLLLLCFVGDVVTHHFIFR